MKQFFYIILASAFTLPACSQAQKEPVAAESQLEITKTSAQQDNLQAAREAFAAQYPQATDVEWEEDANGYYEANFKLAGEKMRADYSREGKWIETESSMKFESLPEAVKRVIKERFDEDDITEIERVDHAERGAFYDVEFKDKGKNKDVEIRENGEIIKE